MWTMRHGIPMEDVGVVPLETQERTATATTEEQHRHDNGTETFFKNFPKTGVNPRTDPVDITLER